MKNNVNQLEGYIYQYESAFNEKDTKLMGKLMEKINSLNVSICYYAGYVEFFHVDNIQSVYSFKIK